MMQDFVGFRFGNVHSKDLHILSVANGNRYTLNLLPDPTDNAMDIPGGQGQYYFGQQFKDRHFSLDIAFDNVDEKTLRRMQQLFSTDKPQDLVFDEMPYKTYRVKCEKAPEFKTVCFLNRETKQRVYKGEATLNFVSFTPYAFCFNKYIIRAADKYLLQEPKDLPRFRSVYDNPYEQKKPVIYNNTTKEFYNVNAGESPDSLDRNGKPWKGGYPTLEQVRAGELYFVDEEGNDKIIDVRRYFTNVPEWAETSQLLVTPTLDMDQDLIFMPQYSKTKNVNMDTGIDRSSALMGTRILVYNPGDVPVDFELRFDNNDRTFWSRGGHFQVRRYNVQRLPIVHAVDWTGLKTLEEDENESYKYGDRYFKISKREDTPKGLYFNEEFNLLGNKHPTFAYIAEPIPREKLAHYIKMFYWQSSLLKDENGNQLLDFEEGIRYANRYQEMYDLCITDEERFELYWKTLNDAILDKYKDAMVFSTEYRKAQENNEAMPILWDFEGFKYNYIHNPPEYIRENQELYYGQFDFNLTKMPQWFTDDYFDIKTDGITKAELFLNTETEMLYNINNPEYVEDNPESYANFYKYKPTKKIYNDNIQKGHWFKLPCGWSLIEITPVCDEDEWGGKRWLDARPFDWGYPPVEGTKTRPNVKKFFDEQWERMGHEWLDNLGITDHTNFDQLMNYRLWYFNEQMIAQGYNPKGVLTSKNYVRAANYEKMDYVKGNGSKDNFTYEFYKTMETEIEYKFLKAFDRFWTL